MPLRSNLANGLDITDESAATCVAKAHSPRRKPNEVHGTQQAWENRGHFFAAAAEAMRRILVEQARHKKSVKGGGDRKRVELALVDAAVLGRQPDILALHEALALLEVQDPRAAELVKLRFFVGMTVEQAADSLGISVTTARTDWTYAKTWLRGRMRDVSDQE